MKPSVVIGVLTAIAIGCGVWIYNAKASADAANAVPEGFPTKENIATLTVTADDIALGSEKAPVTVIEYASLSCPHCAHFHNDTLPVLEKKYITPGSMRFIHRPFPLNKPALRGAQVTLCAGREKYYPFLSILFKAQEKWAFDEGFAKKLADVVKVGGMSEKQVDACLKDQKTEETVLKSRQGGEKLGVNATPTLFIVVKPASGGNTLYKKFEGARSAEEISAFIDPFLKK